MGGFAESDRLRIALLTYRGNPFCGGQGVYVRQLSAALTRLGHSVEVLSGQPYPELVPGVKLTKLESLDLYRPEEPFRPARPPRDWIDAVELSTMSISGFPEPFTFSLRAWRELRGRLHEFDVVHDNQGLGYGLLPLGRRLPLVATIHHPISVDRRLELERASGFRKVTLRRWYAFTRMQRRVARRIPKLATVSESSRKDIARDLGLPPDRLVTIPLAVDAESFRPLERSRDEDLLVATASADVPLKGVATLLEALARVRAQRAARLVVVGRPRPNGATGKLVAKLGLDGAVRFVRGVPETELVELYSQATLAIVPSLYEGFSLPALEAMACGVPLIATTAGALPEVVGSAGVLVPPGDAEALAGALLKLLDDANLRRKLGEGGRLRAVGEFSWRRTAERTVDLYREAAAC
ncbi:MAG TPA: glycosyltransferase family 4 protein [Candidatus Dormibacteraeota bacterium]